MLRRFMSTALPAYRDFLVCLVLASFQRQQSMRPSTFFCMHVSRLAQTHFIHVSAFNGSACALEPSQYGQHLSPECPLLARKFGPNTADRVTQIMQQSKLLRHFQLAQEG